MSATCVKCFWLRADGFKRADVHLRGMAVRKEGEPWACRHGVGLQGLFIHMPLGDGFPSKFRVLVN